MLLYFISMHTKKGKILEIIINMHIITITITVILSFKTQTITHLRSLEHFPFIQNLHGINIIR